MFLVNWGIIVIMMNRSNFCYPSESDGSGDSGASSDFGHSVFGEMGGSGDAGECGNSGSSVDFGKSGNSVEFGKSGESGDS